MQETSTARNLYTRKLNESIAAYRTSLGARPPILNCLVLDHSGSMNIYDPVSNTTPIELLNGSIQTFQQAFQTDPLLTPFFGQIQLAVVSYVSAVKVEAHFAPPSAIQPIRLKAGRLTHTGDAFQKALELVRTERAMIDATQVARSQSVKFLILLLTDGKTSEDNRDALQAFIHTPHHDVTILPIAMGTGANMEELCDISTAARHQVLQMEDHSPKVYAALSSILVSSTSTFSSNRRGKVDLSRLYIPNGVRLVEFEDL